MKKKIVEQYFDSVCGTSAFTGFFNMADQRLDASLGDILGLSLSAILWKGSLVGASSTVLAIFSLNGQYHFCLFQIRWWFFLRSSIIH